MPYVFTGLPADSSELETFKGYHVSSAPDEPFGGPVEPPEDGPEELVLSYSARRHVPQKPVRWIRTEEPNSTRHYPWRAKTMVSNGLLASWLLIPSACFLAIWTLARL
jgi:hypothetical protein